MTNTGKVSARPEDIAGAHNPSDVAQLLDGLRDRMRQRSDAREEIRLNGQPIDWQHWALDLERLTAGQFARLKECLDPKRYADVGFRPIDCDPSAACERAEKLERVALSAGKEVDTPSGWVAWAKGKGYEVPWALEDAVSRRRNEQQPCSPVEGPDLASPQGETLAPVRVHQARRRSDPLSAVIAMARKAAADPTDYQSVWAVLVSIASASDRPPPLLGYVDGEGVKYQAESEEPQFFTKDNLRKRMNPAARGKRRSPPG